MVIQAKQGLDMTEGSEITLRNVKLLTEEEGPVLNVHNSKNINLVNVSYKNNAPVFLNVSGEKTAGIKIEGVDKIKATKGIQYSYGATEKAVETKGN